MRVPSIAFAALLLAGCASPAGPAIPQTDDPASPPSTTALWTFTAIDGATYTSEAPARNATILFFMATWCSTCRSKAPMLAGVAAEYQARGVATYSLDFDATETADDLRAWQERYQQAWPHGIDRGLRIQRLYEVRSQSSVLVLDASGALVKHFGYGQVSERELRGALDEALASA